MAAQNSEKTGGNSLLTDDEVAAILTHGGRELLGWARRVRIEQRALEQLLDGNDGPSRVVPFGRRSSAAWDG